MSMPNTRVSGLSSDRDAYSFILLYSAVLYSVLLIAPVIGAKLVAEYQLNAAQLGLLFSLELGAFSLATLPAYLWLHRVNLRLATYAFTVVVIAGNVVSGLVGSFPALVVTRVVTSLAAGSITVILLSLCGRTGNPSRAFGLWVVSQLTMGALILAVFPVVFGGSGVAGIYWTLAVLAVICLGVVPKLDGNFLRHAHATTQSPAPAPGMGRPVLFVLGLAAVLAFYVALSGVWSFMGRLSEEAGNELGTTSVTLAIATVAGIVSALVATVLGESPHRRLFLAGGYLGMALSVVLLFGRPGILRFAVAAIIFKFAWTFILPYLLATLADLSSHGHVMNTTNLMIGTGFAIGPVLSGVLIERAGGGFSTMLLASTVGVLLSMALALVVHRRPSSTPTTAPDRLEATR